LRTNGQNFYISVESLRNRIASRLIPLFFIALLLNVFLSLMRIPTMGFQPFMLLHAFLFCVGAFLYFDRRRLRPDISVIVMIGILSSLLISGVATLGLLSVTFMLGPMIALYLMLLGHRKSAYTSIVLIVIYISIMGVLFVSGTFGSAASPEVYVRSSAAWMVMIVAVAGVSLAFVAPFELVPGALEGSEERFHLAFENANVGMCLTSLEGHLLKVNAAFCEMLGYTRTELERMSVSDITHPDDKETSLNYIKRQQSGEEKKINFEKRYTHKRGDVVWANVSSSLIFDSRRKPQYFVTHIQNISERKRAEDALIASEAKFRSAFENIQDVYFETTADGTLLEISPSIDVLSEGQCTRNGLLGKSILDFYDDPAVRSSFIDTLREKKHVSDFEIILKNTDGSTVECSISARLQYGADRGSDTITGTIRNISERKKMEALVREQSLFPFLNPGVVFRIDSTGVITLPNPAATGFGLNPGLPVHSAIPDIVTLDLLNCIRDGSIKVFEAHLNERLFRLTARGVQDLGQLFVYGEDITERRRAEEALKASEAKLRAILDNSHDAIGVHVNGIWEMCNAAALRLFGVSSAQELLGTSIFSVISPGERARISGFVRNRNEGSDAPLTYVSRGLRADGTEFDMDVATSSFVLEGKLHVLVILHDVSERKQAEDSLRESEAKLRAMFENSRDAIGVSKKGIHVYANPSYLKLFGFENNSKFTGTSIIDSIAPSHRQQMTLNVQRRAAGEPVPKFYESRGMKVDGTEFDAEFNISTYEYNGEIYSVAVIRDITERKRAEEALRFERLLLRTLVDNIPDSIYSKDILCRKTLANLAEVRNLGVQSEAEILGKDDFKFYPKELAEEFLADDQLVLRTGQPLLDREEYIFNEKGQKRWLLTSKLPLRDSEGRIIGLLGIGRDITERKEAEETLRESEERFRQLAEAAVEGIAFTEKEIFVDGNERLAAMLGYKLEEMIGRPVSDFVAPDSRGIVLGHINERYEGPYEHFVQRKNGSIFPVESRARMMIWKGKKIRVTALLDIGDRKRAEEQLRKLSLAVEQSPASIVITDTKGNIEYVNPKFTQITGYTLEEVQGKNPRILKSGETPQQEYKTMWKTIMSGTDWQGEFHNKKKNGELFWESASISPVKDSNNSITNLVAVKEDITERKRMEEELRRSERHYRLLAENMVDVLWVMDLETMRFTYVSPSVEKLRGFTVEEVMNQSLEEVLTPNSLAHLNKILPDRIKAFLSGEPNSGRYQDEFEQPRKDGTTVWTDVTATGLKNKNGNVEIIGVSRDITERKLAERARQEAEDALRHAQKLESIGTLAGGIAHDFNNLLNAMLGQSTLAIGKLPKESPAKNHIEKSIQAADKAADLTRQLLAYSGKGKFVTEDFDLNRLVEENAQLLEVSVPKTTQLRYELDSSILCVHGDIGQIQQVIMNLIINAGEAMGPNPGYITIHTSRIELAENEAEYRKFTNTPVPPGKYALLQVSDTGHGMKPEVAARIFDPFFTTKFTGRGLGLAAVLGIIRGHKGGISITSEEGKGTEFEIVLPLVDVTTMPGVREMKETPMINGNGKTVLVIDDEPSILELLTDIFSDAKFKVIKASDPIKGIGLYRELQHSVAMVVLDYSMPGMDGKAAFEELVKINKDVRVLLCSGYSEEEMKLAFGDTRPQAFIQKPYKPAELLARVSAIV